MISNGYLRERWVEAHRQDLQREAELRRRARHLRQPSISLIRRSVGRVGAFFVVLGTRLQRLESIHVVRQRASLSHTASKESR